MITQCGEFVCWWWARVRSVIYLFCMDYTKEELKHFYDKVGFENGWDFSKVQYCTEDKAWDFYEEVKRKGSADMKLLDIGTGGGEKVLEIADCFGSIVGIDLSEGMIDTAKQNLMESQVVHVVFRAMDAGRLDFPDQTFDVVSCRHSDFTPSEVYRVLKTGGIFMTQQVGEGDKLNIKECFGRGQAYGVNDGAAMDQYLRSFNSAGFRKIQSFEYDAIEYYSNPEDIIFLLKHTPIIPNFLQESGDFEKLDKFINENRSEKGIKTNSKRYMIVAEK